MIVSISSSIKDFDLVRARIANDEQADIIADEMGQLLVLQDIGEAAKDFRFIWIVDMQFDLVARFAA